MQPGTWSPKIKENEKKFENDNQGLGSPKAKQKKRQTRDMKNVTWDLVPKKAKKNVNKDSANTCFIKIYLCEIRLCIKVCLKTIFLQRNVYKKNIHLCQFIGLNLTSKLWRLFFLLSLAPGSLVRGLQE